MSGPVEPSSLGQAIDRAAYRRTDEEWLEQAWLRGRVVLVSDNRVPVAGDPPRLAFVAPADAPAGERLFLGVDGDDVPYFAVAAATPDVPDAQTATLRSIGHLLSGRDRDLCAAATGLVNWHARYGFSPLTGAPTQVGDGGWVRRAADGRSLLFPRTDPAAIVLVTDGVPGAAGRCLLGRGAAWPEQRYSCLAGFVEPGESAEATVVREVAEEVGVVVHDVRYVTSQPWPFPGSLMLAFTARADPERPLRIDRTELADARWFSREELRELWNARTPIRSSVAYYLMSRWLESE